jgi:hypothetical protein
MPAIFVVCMLGARRASRLTFLSALMWLGCSAGGSGRDGGRDSDDLGLTGNEDLGRIEGRVTIGPLCPVERIPPDPRCSPSPALFAAVKVRILTPSGELVRSVDLDDSGHYAVDLQPGGYLVGTNYPGFGLPGEPDSGTLVDSASSGPGSPPSVPPQPPAFRGDSGPPYVEDPGDDGGPYRVLPVAVQVQAGRRILVDIDIDTGIR